LTLLDVLVMALTQGLGEVLPLGASGLLTALPLAAISADGRAALSVAAHAGTVLALAGYFWRDMANMGIGIWKLAKGKPDQGSLLVLHVAAGTIPAALAGWALAVPAEGLIGPLGASILLLVGGILLVLADRLGVTVRRIEHMGILSAIGLGALQILALLPGVSRTGITITAARLLGWERQAAMRFSLLLAIPLLAGHGIYTAWTLSHRTKLILSADLTLAALAAGLSSLVAVAAVMAWVGRNGFGPIALVRILAGIAGLAFVLMG
jgi:undecaprenyl-diphosphatase